MRFLKVWQKKKWKALCFFSVSFFFAACSLSFLIYAFRWEKDLEAKMNFEIQRKSHLEEFLSGYRSLKEIVVQFPKGEAPMDVLANGLDRLKGRFPTELVFTKGTNGHKGEVVFELQGISSQEELLDILAFLESFYFPVLLVDTVELTPSGCKVKYTIMGVLKVPYGKV